MYEIKIMSLEMLCYYSFYKPSHKLCYKKVLKELKNRFDNAYIYIKNRRVYKTLYIRSDTTFCILCPKTYQIKVSKVFYIKFIIFFNFNHL